MLRVDELTHLGMGLNCLKKLSHPKVSGVKALFSQFTEHPARFQGVNVKLRYLVTVCLQVSRFRKKLI